MSNSPLTKLLQQNENKDQNEARVIRQRELLEKITTSTEQYAYLTGRYSYEKLLKIMKHLDHFKYGINASAPIVCLGPVKCPFFHACPIGDGFAPDPKTQKPIPQYDSIEDFPIGNQCIVEKVYVEQKLIDYVQEFDVDPSRPSELALINDLALVDLYKNRAILFMANGDRDGEGIDFMKIDIGWDGETGVQTSKASKEHPVFGVIDKLEKRRHKILEELLATRRTRAHAAAKFGSGVQTSQLMTEIEKLRKAIEMKRGSVLSLDNEGPQEITMDEEIIELE